ncbi:MAG: succinate--CoA ligase subunit alpha [Candidatus Colwellbacteria bacterium]|nr:succinate--CoA ligase subunit alpha [Candidatus Colwellbacteria bacterium]
MAILVDKKTRVLVQGITGKEGARACGEMLSYGTKVVAGVTPGKKGQKVSGVSVYDTVKEALKKHPEINTSLISVPAFAVKDAAMEAIFAGIKLINILAEHVPTRDSTEIVRWARIKGSTVVGPASVGIISPGKGKIGSIGSSTISSVFTKGSIGVVSKSGGMTAEIAVTLTKAKLGQSTVIGIGGDQIIGLDFVDALKLFAKDPETKAVVLFGEVGGTYEEQAADYILKEKFKKPVVAIIAGKFTKDIPQGTILGHAGTIVARGRGSYESKARAFAKAGVPVARTLDEVPSLIRKAISSK